MNLKDLQSIPATNPGRLKRQFILSKRCVYLVVALLFTLTTFAQEKNKKGDWWTSITKKHGIKYDSYTLHGDCFIVGEITLDGEIENFRDVTVISKGAEDYWIFKSKSASYDRKTTTLSINDCTMEQFYKDPESLEPEKSYKHINYSINIDRKIATMADVRPDDEIESAINKMFEESIIAGEHLDFDKMKSQIDDRFSSGFINDGKYFKSFDLLFAEYKMTANGIKHQKLTIDHKKITILSDNSVLLTASGQFSATTINNNVVNGKFVWTIIYKEINNEWKIIHTNMSNTR